MQTNLDVVSAAVRKVLEDLVEEQAFRNGFSGIVETIDEAVEKAVVAQKQLIELPLERRKVIVESIRNAALAENERLSALAVKET